MVRSLYPHPDVVLYESPKRPSIVETIEEVVANVVGILRFIIDEYLMYQEDDTGDDLDEDSNRRRIRKLEGEHIQETLRRIFFSPLTRKRIFILSCVAVSIDPLFFYIPIINEEKKCLGIDKNLRAAALCLRALPDATFILHIISSGLRLYPNVDLYFVDLLYYSFVSILVAVFLMLPIPQLAILVFFFKSGGSGHFSQRVTVNIFLFIYYVARVFLIFIYSQNLKYKTGKWVRASFNFLLYIIASNVVGGFWYFFSIQREISCWDQSCRNAIGCGGPTYYCSGSTSRDITFLNELCPINPQNTTTFNFGIFFDAIQSGSTRSVHFPTKFFYCIWWGVKNLSNFGTNLETSSYVWENCFAVITSIIGMLLFFYLLGNVQIYMQQAMNKSLADEDKAEDLRPKIVERKRAIKMWMEKFALPDDLKKTIMGLISRNLEGKLDGDVDLNFMFYNLPEYKRYLLQRYFCSETVGKVKELQTMGKEELETISEDLQPKIFQENDTVVEAGQPLHSMLFIISGTMQAYVPIRDAPSPREAARTKTFEKGMFFGEQLLDWAVKTKTFDDQPPSDKTVRCSTKVEAFALTVDDLKTLVKTGKLKMSGEV